MKNSANVKFLSLSVNESFARMCVSSFVAPLNPTIEELNDIKTAVSEAVTNSIIHAYQEKTGKIILTCEIFERRIKIIIKEFNAKTTRESNARALVFELTIQIPLGLSI